MVSVKAMSFRGWTNIVDLSVCPMVIQVFSLIINFTLKIIKL